MNTIAKLTITRSGYLIELTELGKQLAPGEYDLVPVQQELPQTGVTKAHIDRFEAALSDLGPGTVAAAKLVCDIARAAISSPAQDKLDELALLCAEAYQVVGSLLYDVGAFDDDHAQKILDNLSQARRVHTDVLPWPTFTNPNKEEADAPTETRRD